MNQIQMYESLKTLPKEMLLRYAQNPIGGVPQYMAIAALQYQNEIQNSKPTPPPQGTVKDEVIRQAVQPKMAQGIQQLPPQQPQPQPQQMQPQEPVMQAAHGGLAELHVPDHMFQEHNMAGGGIVAFDEGGHVPRFDGVTNGSLVTDNMTQEQFLRLPPETRKLILQRENDRRMIARPFAAAGDMVAGPTNYIAAAQSQIANAVGIPRLGRALGIYDPDDTKVEVPRIGTGSSTPLYDPYRNDITEQSYASALPKTEGEKGMPYVSDKATRKALTAQNAAALGVEPTKTPADKSDKSDKSAQSTGIPSLSGNVASYKVTPYTPQTLSLTTAQEEADAAKKLLGGSKEEFMAGLQKEREAACIKDVYEKQRSELNAEKEKSAGDKDKAVWLSLLEGSLATMAGNSPHALQNIGAGAFKGVNSYNTAMDKIKQNEKELRREGNALDRDQQTMLEARLRGDKAEYQTVYDRWEKRSDKVQALENQNTAIRNAANEYNATQTTEASKFGVQQTQENRRANAQIAAHIKAAQISADATTQAAIARALAGQTLNPLEKARLNKLAGEAYTEYTSDPANKDKTLMSRETFISQYISNLGGSGGGYTPSGKVVAGKNGALRYTQDEE